MIRLTRPGWRSTLRCHYKEHDDVATREVLDAIPTARTIEARALLIPGVRNAGMAEGQYWPTVHGSAAGDALTYNDGMRARTAASKR